MDIFFVRHGETEHNREHLHQPGTTALTERGRAQAARVSAEVQKLSPDTLISSTLTRASQTAKIIGEKIQIEHEENVLFSELKRPEFVFGLKHFSVTSLRYIWKWFFSKDEAYWKKVDGESRNGFLMRISEAKHYLETLPKDAVVVVVSHSIFINFFIEHICNERPIGIFGAALLLLKIKTLDNSSMTHVTYDPSLADGTCKWNLVSFDDDEHVKHT